MRTPGRAGKAALTVLSAAALLGQDGARPDPWELPAPDAAHVMKAVIDSKDRYTVVVTEFYSPKAQSPDRIDPPATIAERKGMEACRALIDRGSLPEAAFAARDLLRKNPALHDARMLLGKALLAQGRPKEAAVALRDSLIGNRRNPEARNLMARTAGALGVAFLHEELRPPCWVREDGKGRVEVGVAGRVPEESPIEWLAYGTGRVYFRYEGPFDAAFPGKSKASSLREHLYGIGTLLIDADVAKRAGQKISPRIARLLVEKKSGNIVPFVFFALYPDPVPPDPEADFELLRPRLEKYFDEKILVRK